MFVSDLRHFLDMPDDAPAPARAMAAQLFDLVRVATAGDSGRAWVSALTCRRRPANRACRGYMVVFRPGRSGRIEWRCERCGDEGVISGWEDSPFDLQRSSTAAGGAREQTSVVGDDVAAVLRDLQLLDSRCEQLVCRMEGTADGAVLTAAAVDLDELLGFVAAEANNETDRRRSKRLDDAFEVLEAVLDTFPDDEERVSVIGAAVPLEGLWRIVEMELWDREAMDLVEPAFVDFAADGTGQFAFIAVRGWIDWRLEESGRLEFSWEGVDEGDPVNGRGWALPDGDGALTGRIYIHNGDNSSFRAVRSVGLVHN